MTWEIAVGIFSMLAAFISVVNAAVKINRAIVLLESAVKELKAHITEQGGQALRTKEKIDRLDRRVFLLESKNAAWQTHERQQL